ncbi:alpha/beta fold hydrolase [Gayadomonas joobiniege]|uniref:alpha/beta fold hydrolase n=1 Tax=Gayadomonas joobiniege TaxID=1234606 RepID=UPI000374862B|nr:alpha/beta fold hydrolase [Gayadomonas joobiniege]
MQLFSKISGSGEPLVILHGLFGQADNLAVLAKAASQHYKVIQFDLRNHGQSPHHDVLDYASMANDVLTSLNSLDIQHCHLFGHSMGGKVAMQLALNQPTLVRSLIIEDIAPVTYPDRHSQIIKTLKAININTIKNRQHVLNELSESIDDATSQFLLKGLKKSHEQWHWQFNLTAIEQNYHNICAFPRHSKQFNRPTLFIKGGLSDYITQNNYNSIDNYFPLAKFKIIQGAGHWAHAEKPNIMNKIVLDFLQKQAE